MAICSLSFASLSTFCSITPLPFLRLLATNQRHHLQRKKWLIGFQTLVCSKMLARGKKNDCFFSFFQQCCDAFPSYTSILEEPKIAPRITCMVQSVVLHATMVTPWQAHPNGFVKKILRAPPSYGLENIQDVRVCLVVLQRNHGLVPSNLNYFQSKIKCT